MELKGEQRIPLEPAYVWDALNDPAVLQASIPGCESVEPTEDGYKVVMLAAIGPVKARFNGKLSLSNVTPPRSYTIAFEGSGGAAGFGNGQADVMLAPAEGGTLLTYTAQAKVGGKIAQVGSRLIDSVAARMAAEFFTRFNRSLVPPETSDTSKTSSPKWKFWQ